MTDALSAHTFAVITGGGTAGHVLPALAIAESLHDAGHDPPEIYYVGAQRGIETELLPDTPYPHSFLDVVGLQRSISRRNLAFLPKLIRATTHAIALLRRLRPEVVVSVGGYASLPAVFAARWLRIPVVVVSFDRRPGKASALAARFAAASAVAFAGSDLPRAEITGAPVRRAIRTIDRQRDRESARAELAIPADRFLVSVVGGSLGSAALNEAVASYVERNATDTGLAVLHVAGERFASEIAGRHDPDGVWHRVVGFEPRIDLVWAATDLMVGRGGASTVAEVATTGTPAILVPWAASAEDHQTANVRWLADDGAAVLLKESELAGLADTVEALRSDPARRQQLGASARRLGAANRSGALPALIERVALASNPP